MKYCMKCGRQLPDDAAFCCACGCVTDSGTAPKTNDAQAAANPGTELLQTLSRRIQTNGIIWLVIGIVQLAMGVYFYYEGYMWLLIVAALNVWGGIADCRYSQTVRSDPRGIVDRFKPLFRPYLA